MNIGQWPLKRALTHPHRPFLKEGSREFDNRTFNDRVNRMAHALHGLGCTTGQRVAVMMVNSSEFLEILFACSKIGAIMVPLNGRLAVPELVYILSDCTPMVLVYSSDYAEKVEPITPTQPWIKHYLKHRGDELLDDPSITDSAASLSTQEPIPEGEIGLAHPLIIMYTSGTTGQPKGAVLSHENLLFGAIHSIIGYGINETTRSLVVAPLFHIGALAASATPIIYAGGCLVLASFYNSSEIIHLIARERVNYMFAVPAMYEMMTRTPEWGRADLSHVHFFIAGGAPMPVPLIRKYQEEKGIRFAQGYGMTETLRLTALDLEHSIRKAGSVGKEVFHVFVRIVNDAGEDVRQGEVGEILVKGPTVFLGYWNRPRETEEAMRGGWFHTGDLGRRDEEGFLYIVGRKVDMIISSGENIYSAEVERAIESMPQVREAAAVGMPDRKRGEVVAAFVLANEGVNITEDEVIEGLRGKIASFKIPKRIFFVKEFPKNSAGKILKKDLRARLPPSH